MPLCALRIHLDEPDRPVAIGEEVRGVVEVLEALGASAEVEVSCAMGVPDGSGEPVWEGLVALEPVVVSEGEPGVGARLPFAVRIPHGVPPTRTGPGLQVAWMVNAGTLGFIRAEERRFTVASEDATAPDAGAGGGRSLFGLRLRRTAVEHFRRQQIRRFRARTGLGGPGALRPAPDLRLTADRLHLCCGDEVRAGVEVLRPDHVSATARVGLVCAEWRSHGHAVAVVHETWRPVDLQQPPADLTFRVDPGGPCSVEGARTAICWYLALREASPSAAATLAGATDAADLHLWVDAPRRRPAA